MREKNTAGKMKNKSKIHSTLHQGLLMTENLIPVTMPSLQIAAGKTKRETKKWSYECSIMQIGPFSAHDVEYAREKYLKIGLPIRSSSQMTVSSFSQL